MKINRDRVAPKKTNRALIVDFIEAKVVLSKNKKNGKKELLYFRVEDKDLIEAVRDLLNTEDKELQEALTIDDNTLNAAVCKYYEPLIAGKKKVLSCNYCKSSHDCFLLSSVILQGS